MPQNQKFDKINGIEQALDVFWEKGYEATSLTDLTKKLDVGKGSFYNAYKSKKALFHDCINLFRGNSIQNLKDILSSEKDIKNGIKNYLVYILYYSPNDAKQKGCFLTNACTELASSDVQVSKVLDTHYQTMQDIITDYLILQGGFQQNEAVLKASVIVTYFIGLTVQLKLEIKKDQVTESIEKFIQSLF